MCTSSTLQPVTLLALRRVGPYSDYSNLPPFSAGDRYWSRIEDFAKKHDISIRCVPITVPYDNPDWTPPELQQLDACLPVVGDDRVAGASEGFGSGQAGTDIRRIEFA